jgi:hypothetical protein
MRSATHMISRTATCVQQHDDTTTQGLLTTLHDKCQHGNSNHLTTACYKTFWRNHIHAVTEIIYTLWHVQCVTRRDKLSFHMIRRGRSRHEPHSVPRHCAKHITQMTNQHRHVCQQIKQKCNKELFMRNRTYKHQWWHCKITDMLKHGYEIYDVLHITHRLTLHKVINITTKPYLRRGCF